MGIFTQCQVVSQNIKYNQETEHHNISLKNECCCCCAIRKYFWTHEPMKFILSISLVSLRVCPFYEGNPTFAVIFTHAAKAAWSAYWYISVHSVGFYSKHLYMLEPPYFKTLNNAKFGKMG